MATVITRYEPEGLHKRLQILEIVMFVSLVLNVVTGYIALHANKQANQAQAQTEVR